MVTVYSRMLARSSIWGGHAADGVDHNEAQGVPARAIHAHTFGLQRLFVSGLPAAVSGVS
jgi:hypothetical protein